MRYRKIYAKISNIHYYIIVKQLKDIAYHSMHNIFEWIFYHSGTKVGDSDNTEICSQDPL